MITNCKKETEVPSCKTYYLLSNENGDSGTFNDECLSLQDKFPYSGISDHCKKLAGNLVNFCSNDEKNYPLNYECELLHHWLFNEIFNNPNLTDDSQRDGVINRFYHTWENIVSTLSCENKCQPNPILLKSLTPEELRFRKDMYEYIYNYKNFDKITTSEKICNTLTSYLPTMLEKYGYFKSSCQSTNKKCLHDAKSLEDYNPEKLCQEFECKKEALCSKYFHVEQEKSHTRVAGSHEGAESPDIRDSEDDALMDKSQTSTIMTTVGPSLLGLFMSSFILFKLKPIRSWLNNQILKNRNVEEYMVEESSSELLNDYFIHGDTGSEEKGYGITYHSS
ncbi:PIR Superfamily Protein [Plasmodium ovale wallikeri]|uniref:PIR Superfamily Protein n=2 Tax=Plasmodium ovale TaxID=36330 RepID=A0A1A9AGA4_PLAOA|nr:PIR Superfamily Protein [Plasmodium ovale wallikeri]SBT58811.1 PIR Superfamily Protein [Plasmodium ovale wallikeri]SBT73550.1 Plasmodium vivax Vir protein, putative [Plasmodium ovale]